MPKYERIETPDGYAIHDTEAGRNLLGWYDSAEVADRQIRRIVANIELTEGQMNVMQVLASTGRLDMRQVAEQARNRVMPYGDDGFGLKTAKLLESHGLVRIEKDAKGDMLAVITDWGYEWLGRKKPE